MKNLLLFILVAGSATLGGSHVWAQAPSMDALLSTPKENLTQADFLVNERAFVTAVNALPADSYKATVQALGDRYASSPAIVSHILARLQKQCERDQQLERLSAATPAASLEQASYQLAEEFLSDLNKDGQNLPNVIAAHQAQQIAAGRQCPYEFLYQLATPKVRMDEDLARSEARALNEIKLDVAAAAPLAVSAANLALRTGIASMSVGSVAQQLLIGSVASFAVYQVLQNYAHTQREKTLMNDWKNAKSQLENRMQNGPPGSIAPAADQFYLATMNVYAFYSYNLIAANLEADTHKSQPSFRIRNIYANQCQTAIDKRFLLQALKTENSPAVASILKNTSCELKYDFTRWVAEWNGNKGFQNRDEWRNKRAEFIHSRSPEKAQFIENQEKKLHASWGICDDPLYFLFTVVDSFNTWSAKHPELFSSQPELLEVKDQIQNKVVSSAQIRQNVLSSFSSATNSCPFAKP